MRIIAGKLKGRIIKVPKSKLVRPTTDKNRESIFNYLTNIFEFENAKVLDLYAGSGSLGFEALSRGAKLVVFVEKNYKIFNNLKENSKLLNTEENVRIYKSDATKFTSSDTEKYHLIIADPPFFHFDIYAVYQNIFENNMLEENGIFIIERSIQTLENDMKYFKKEPSRRLGDSVIYEFSN